MADTNAIEAFEGLNNVLETEYESQTALVEATPPFVPDTQNNPLEEDKLYLMNQLKKLDHDLDEVAKVLKAEIKMGSKTNFHVVYAQLVKTKLDIIKEMRELDFAYEAAKKRGKADKANVSVNMNMNLTSDDLFSLTGKPKEIQSEEV